MSSLFLNFLKLFLKYPLTYIKPYAILLLPTKKGNPMEDFFDEVCSDLDDGIKPCAHYIQGGFCTLDQHYLCIEYLRRNAPSLSYSSMKEFISCHRKFWWSHIVGLQ